MPLTDRQIRALKPAAKPYRETDGMGLYVEVGPSGSKLWRWKYRFGGKEKRLSLGAYPVISLAEARDARDQARALLAKGHDPSVEKKRQKAAARVGAADSFEAVAEDYIVTRMEKEARAPATIKKARWFLTLLKPSIGKLPVADVDPVILLEALRKIQAKGNFETAKKTRSFASRVFRFAVATGRAKTDPASVLVGALNDAVRNCLSVAKANTVRSLPEALAQQNPIKTRAVVFHLPIGARAVLNEALVAFGAKPTHRGLVGKDEALSRLVLFAMEKGGHLD